MDEARYAEIAHRTLPFAAPTRAEAFDELVASLDLAEGARVLDLGCGKAELSSRIAERYGAHILGIDLSPRVVATANARVLRRGTLTARVGDLDDLPEATFDLVINVGAMPPGQQGLAIRRWAALAPHVVYGDAYWRTPPPVEYLAALGCTPADMADLAGARAWADDASLLRRFENVTTHDEFTAYEASYRANVLAWCAENPADPEAAAMLARAEAWWGVHSRWGREGMGFVLVAAGRG